MLEMGNLGRRRLPLQRWEFAQRTPEARGGCSLQLSPLPCPPDEAFEALRIEPFSSPPELPDVMKPQDSGSSANEQAVQ